VLESASRSIDGHCGRQFNKSGSAEARVFDPWWSCGGQVRFELGDVVSIASIAGDDGSGTYPTAWDASSYILTPRNAAAKGWPYTELVPPTVLYVPAWPVTVWPIRITGIFGWPSVPAPVKEVCFMLANRLKSLWDAPFGLSGGGDAGALDMTVSLNPILKQMLMPYKVMAV
jgi:hypothetical protein